MPNRRLFRGAVCGFWCLLTACALVGPRASSPARAPMPPMSGLEVIGAMRYAYPSRAIRSLAFTISEERAGATRAIRVRAHARLPGRIRETRLPSSTRTGYVRNRMKLSVFEAGRRVQTANRVDLATLLAYDVFSQSIDTTLMWLDSARVRYGIVRRDEFEGRDVWVVGARKGDTTSSQFWVDADRWYVRRVIQRDPRDPGDIVDTRFQEFSEFLTVPLPVRIVTYRNGTRVATREISDVAVNPRLPSQAFDLSQWREVRR